MAIDSAEKRRSAAGVPFLPLGPGVTPNSDKDQEWRQQAAWGYSGIEVEVEIVTVSGDQRRPRTSSEDSRRGRAGAADSRLARPRESLDVRYKR